MKAKKSPLEFKTFFVLNSNLEFISLTEPDIAISKTVNSYEIDIDYSITKFENEYHVFTKVGINNKQKPKPGYKIFCEGLGIYSIKNEQTLTDEEFNNLINYSTITLNIGFLRSIIENLTFRAPWGRYILPAIDTQALIDSKIKSLKKNIRQK